MQKMTRSDIDKMMTQIHGWQLEGETIKKEWQFRDFTEAMVFINKIADLAEQHDHHPELFNVYNKVALKFSTHDAGGLTLRDFKIAAEIDKLL
jgi:4a-hydroxytetrahydrobiopterin dehydratase